MNFLGTPGYALHAAILVDVWKTTPFVALLLLAGLQAIPEDLYRAARVDGASAPRIFRSITLPLLRPAIAARPALPERSTRSASSTRFTCSPTAARRTPPRRSPSTPTRRCSAPGDFGYGSTLVGGHVPVRRGAGAPLARAPLAAGARRRPVSRRAALAVAIPYLAFLLLPVGWLALTSLWPEGELTRALPEPAHARELRGGALRRRPFLRALGNSLLVAGATTALALAARRAGGLRARAASSSAGGRALLASRSASRCSRPSPPRARSTSCCARSASSTAWPASSSPTRPSRCRSRSGCSPRSSATSRTSSTGPRGSTGARRSAPSGGCSSRSPRRASPPRPSWSSCSPGTSSSTRSPSSSPRAPHRAGGHRAASPASTASRGGRSPPPPRSRRCRWWPSRCVFQRRIVAGLTAGAVKE